MFKTKSRMKKKIKLTDEKLRFESLESFRFRGEGECSLSNRKKNEKKTAVYFVNCFTDHLENDFFTTKKFK